MGKKDLNETEICMRYITPAVEKAGWDVQRQVRREASFTAGRIIVRGKLVARGEQKRADYALFYKRNLPLAIIEAKDNKKPVGAGMQQALEYAETLDVPFVFTSNGAYCSRSVVPQRVRHAGLEQIGSLGELHLAQLLRDRLGLLHRLGPVLLDVDGLEHRRALGP